MEEQENGNGKILKKKGRDGVWRAVPSLNQIQELLFSFHDSVCAGHYAAEVTYRRILEAGYTWPTLYKDCNSYCKSCDRC